MACPALHCISTLSHKWPTFKKKVIKHMCWFSLHLLPKHFSFYEQSREIWSKIYTGLHVKYLSFVTDCNETLIFLTDFWKILVYQISWKFIQWVQSSMRAEGQTDMTKLTVVCCNFVHTPKNGYKWNWNPMFTLGTKQHSPHLSLFGHDVVWIWMKLPMFRGAYCLHPQSPNRQLPRNWTFCTLQMVKKSSSETSLTT
jgi:hypothetical protein